MALTVQSNDYLDRFFGFAEIFLCGQDSTTDFKLDPVALEKQEENEFSYLNTCVCTGMETLKLTQGESNPADDATANETDDDETVEEPAEPARGRSMSRGRSILGRSLSRGRSRVRKQEKGQARARSVDGWSRLKTGLKKASPTPGWSRVTSGIKIRSRSKTPGRSRRKLSVPRLSVPKVSVRKLSVPKLSVPKVSVPRVSLPKVSVPRVSMPKVSVPRVSMPKVSVPKVKMPKVSAPKVSLPCKGKQIENSVVTNTEQTLTQL